jgi:predicted nucleotide-binding protein
VPKEKTESVLLLILEGAEQLGFITTIKDKYYVSLEKTLGDIGSSVELSPLQTDLNAENVKSSETGNSNDTKILPAQQPSKNNKVFISHGKNKDFIEPIKKLLRFGELEPIVSIDKQSVSQPVPDKVLNDMRGCGAAIIHVEDEMKLMDKETNEHIVLNPNVLIEIGAAMALYGRRFILVVKDGVRLPTNLQGLYEVRYSGVALDGGATIKLLEAINDIKNHPSPNRYSEHQEIKT